MAMAQLQLDHVLTSRDSDDLEQVLYRSRNSTSFLMEATESIISLERMQPVFGCRFTRASQQTGAPMPARFLIIR